MVGLEIRSLTRFFGETPALQDVSFDVVPGEIVAVLGPSGSGKSTLLWILAGLQQPDSGDVLWEGQSLLETPPHRRGFGLMFQDYALFPHLNVFENLAFGLRMAGWENLRIQGRVAEMLDLVGLAGFAKRDVLSLSGGEQQRIALGRALAPQPRLLLLDEPLGALDRLLRERLLLEMQVILRQTRQTALYVTHDQEEAFVLADRVVLLNQGLLEQVDTPQRLYCCPRTEFAARFLGLDNILPGVLRQDGGNWSVSTALGSWPLTPEQLTGRQPTPGQTVSLLIRPEAASLEAGDQTGEISGTVESCIFRGSVNRLGLRAGEFLLSFHFPAGQSLPPVGAQTRLAFDPAGALQILG